MAAAAVGVEVRERKCPVLLAHCQVVQALLQGAHRHLLHSRYKHAVARVLPDHQVVALGVEQVLDELHIYLYVRHADTVCVEGVVGRLVEDLSSTARDHADGLRLDVAQCVGLASTCLSISHHSAIVALQHIIYHILYPRQVHILLRSTWWQHPIELKLCVGNRGIRPVKHKLIWLCGIKLQRRGALPLIICCGWPDTKDDLDPVVRCPIVVVIAVD
mmetsp:Transcript_488/g.1257  ORF Transcript_488/g.1257 Transcript_488/m.1257 type:complete len:217 (-) Transcript_488:119-769(-)